MDYKTCLENNSIIEGKEYYKNAVRIMGDLKKIDPMILNYFLYSPAVSPDDLILARKRVEEMLIDKEWCKLFGIGDHNFENDVVLPLTVISLFENARVKSLEGKFFVPKEK